MVAAVIEQHRDEIGELCRKNRVRRLEVFGSAADGTFDPARSDIDFLVEYLPLQSGEHYETYFGLIEGLERLFGRRIDLVDATCLRNPYFIEGVNESRTLVYEAQPQAGRFSGLSRRAVRPGVLRPVLGPSPVPITPSPFQRASGPRASPLKRATEEGWRRGTLTGPEGPA